MSQGKLIEMKRRQLVNVCWAGHTKFNWRHKDDYEFLWREKKLSQWISTALDPAMQNAGFKLIVDKAEFRGENKFLRIGHN